MSKRSVTNVAASVRQRLLNRARERGEEFQLVLTLYAIERLLYRLSQSERSGGYILKGAMLYQVWGEPSARLTRDLDLLGFGPSDVAAVAGVFREMVSLPVQPEDGLVFVANSVRADEIRGRAKYRGVRVRFEATLDSARIPLQVDVGFGDVVVPEPTEEVYPAMLDFPAPTIRTYPRESVVAEKFEALVALSTGNTRMKDFYDLWHLSQSYDFDGATLGRSVRATFERRETPLPASLPLGLSSDFLGDTEKQTQWTAFVRRTNAPGADGMGLEDVGRAIGDFIMPTVEAEFDGHWPSGGQWS